MSFVFHNEPCVPNCWWHCRSGCRRRNKLKGVSAVNNRVHFIIISTRGCPSITLRSSIHPRRDARGGFKGMTGLGGRVALAKVNALIWILQHVCAINEAKFCGGIAADSWITSEHERAAQVNCWKIHGVIARDRITCPHLRYI